MATDNTEPKSGLILQIAILCIAIVVGLRFGLVSYFNMEMGDEYAVKVGTRKSVQLADLRAEEHRLLTTGPLPIDRAIAKMAHESRASLGEGLAPKPSNDVAAMEGWSQNPRHFEATANGAGPGTTTPTMDDAGVAGTAPTDGGVLDAGLDGGATATTTADSLKDGGINPLTMGGNLISADAGILPKTTSPADAGVTPASGAPKKAP